MRLPGAPWSLRDVLTIWTSNDYHDTKIAHDMATILKKDDNISGKSEQDINDLIAAYT